MYIRAINTRNKKTGTIYTKHTLVESIQTPKGPRQRVIMHLGQLTIPRVEWKLLASILESKLSGQESLFGEVHPEIDSLAQTLISNNQLSKQIQSAPNTTGEAKEQYEEVDLGSVNTIDTRSAGAETVCQWAWERLKFDKLLKEIGMNARRTAIAQALIFGRLISPGSERHIYEWFQKRTTLPDMAGGEIVSCGKDMFYSIGDKLYEKKDSIETALYQTERKLYPHTSATIFLYDLTNTYMEGSCLKNTLAQRGHCKSKRTDCPLITLSLVVDGDGMPIASHIYKGNQSEPETMKDMIERVQTTLRGEQETLFKPTIAMDRGIATAENIEYLREHGYPYVVIRREDGSDAYREQFLNGMDTFELVGDSKKSAYGDENNVYVRKMDGSHGGTCEVLCMSEGRARKERAIDDRREGHFLEDVAKFDRSIKAGNIKRIDKIEARKSRLAGRHKSVAKHYEISTLLSPDGKVTGVAASKVSPEDENLYGCYIIESTHVELSGKEIWGLYMTLTRVEKAFRAMKSTLGMRPVFHQTDDRSGAHLFITVLAYHLLAVIERRLLESGDHRQWATIRDALSTHTRNTVIFQGKAGNVYHVRVTALPDDGHRAIYDALGIKPQQRRMISRVKTASDTL
jgi:transposase